MRPRAAFAFAFVLACVALVRAPRDARAALPSLEEASRASDPAVASEALFEEAEAEDAAGDYAHAIAHYRAAVERLPSFRHAPKATTRATLLAAHAEGDFRPYARLESVRRDPRASDDAATIDALARDAQTFPPGPTRGEAWMVCADAFLARLHRRADGEAALRKVTDDPAADMLLRRQATSELVNALLGEGAIDEASAVAIALHDLVDAHLTKRVAVAARRRSLHHASVVDLVVFGLLASFAVARSARRRGLGDVTRALRRGAVLIVGFAVYVAIAGGFLASAYEAGNAEPFLVFGALLVPIAVVARAWSAAGSTSPAARAGRGLMSASAVVAAAFLVLEAVNAQYLEGFKL